MTSTTAILSFLHEPAATNSATRLFRDRPVVEWTLRRLGRAERVDAVTLLCWDDQRAAIAPIAAEFDVNVVARPRTAIASLDTVSAALRWADGWRGGLLGACHADRGFHAPFVKGSLTASTDLVALVDPAAGLLDPAIVDALIAHAGEYPNLEFFFTQAAPGLAGVLLRPSLIDRLAQSGAYPGRLLTYSPDLPGRDPMTTDACVPVPAPIARTTHRFTLDSVRQIRHVGAATAGLNGQLISTGASGLLDALNRRPAVDSHPRELVLELNTTRVTRPIYSPATHLSLGRGDVPLETVRTILGELAGVDDLRLTLAGAGDPLLHPQFPQILALIDGHAIPAVHVETDLLDVPDAAFEALAAARVDVLSVHLPAATRATYERVMGVDGYAGVFANLKRLLAPRRPLPIVVPTFTKCRENLDEMEAWYDHWTRVLGAAVIIGPGDYAGQIPDHAAADMSPASRRPCARLRSRMTILSDGTVASCEQDVTARQPMGKVGGLALPQIWQGSVAELRADHARLQFENRPACAACREWHRP